MAFEERWAGAVLAGFAPPSESPHETGLAPRDGEVDYLVAMREMMRKGTSLSRLGFRAALFIAALSPFWMRFRFRTFVSLAPAERAEMLARLLRHRIFMVRELMLLLKLCACMALFRSDAIRARSGYDRADEDEMPRAVLDSGERVRLPIARQADSAAGSDAGADVGSAAGASAVARERADGEDVRDSAAEEVA